MGRARAGRKWLPAEEDILLEELCGDSTLLEVAARHKRSSGAIAARLDKLLTPQREFTSHDDLFVWARSEMRKGRSGPLGWAWDRAATAAGYPVTGQSATKTGRTPARIKPATAKRRAEVIAIWSSIISSAGCAELATEQPHGEELDVLSAFDDPRLHAAGNAVMRATGELRPAQWVLEADWPGIEWLDITAEQICTGVEGVQQAGAELLVAGLGHSTERDREIMQMRLGFTGDAMAIKEVAERYWLSRERIQQIQGNVIKHARVGQQQAGARRCWHHVHDTLRAALGSGAGQAQLDPDLVLSFVELVTPFAPRDLAVSLVASLCGLRTDDTRTLFVEVEERHEERVQLRQQRALEEKKRGKLTAKIQRLITRSEWPAGYANPDRCTVSPQRDPRDQDQRSNSGHWMSQRLGREVGYDSEAELRMFQLVDAMDDLVESYCEQPVTIPYSLYGRWHVYFPDLLVDFRDGRRLLIEVKARLDDFAVYENVVKFEAAREYCRAKGWGFIATTDRIQTKQDLLQRQVDDRIEEALRAHLATGPTGWYQIEPLVREYNVLYSDIATLALRNGWYWHKGPFRLSAKPLQRLNDQDYCGSLSRGRPA